MRYLALPWWSRRVGRPVVVLVQTVADDAPVVSVPEGALFFTTRWPTAARMARVPKALPGASCYDMLDPPARRAVDRDWEDWIDGFLAEVLEAPDGTFVAEDFQFFGPDRDLLGTGILRAWGWIEDELGGFPTLPAEPMAELLAEFALKTRRLPSELLRLPFPEFVMDYRIVCRKIEADPDRVRR